jgi:hypothetical protein
MPPLAPKFQPVAAVAPPNSPKGLPLQPDEVRELRSRSGTAKFQ